MLGRGFDVDRFPVGGDRCVPPHQQFGSIRKRLVVEIATVAKRTLLEIDLSLASFRVEIFLEEGTPLLFCGFIFFVALIAGKSVCDFRDITKPHWFERKGK